MADLSQTAANVGLSGVGGTLRNATAGEAITQGQPVYRLSSDQKYYRCDSDAEASAIAAGIAMTPAATDGNFVLAENSSIVDLGATLTVGETYCVSTNVGAVAPIGDLTTGDYITILGVATVADTLPLNIYVSGAAKP